MAEISSEVSHGPGHSGRIWHTSDQLAVAALANLTSMSDHNDTRRSRDHGGQGQCQSPSSRTVSDSVGELYFPGPTEQPERAYPPGHLASDQPLRIRAYPGLFGVVRLPG
jgi:hypothetical protein